MFVVKKQDVFPVGTNLVCEASTIGLGPGEWPDFVAVVDEKGSGFLFGPTFDRDKEGGRIYFSRASAIGLHILND